MVQLSDPQGGVPEGSASQPSREVRGTAHGRSTVEATTFHKGSSRSRKRKRWSNVLTRNGVFQMSLRVSQLARGASRGRSTVEAKTIRKGSSRSRPDRQAQCPALNPGPLFIRKPHQLRTLLAKSGERLRHAAASKLRSRALCRAVKSHSRFALLGRTAILFGATTLCASACGDAACVQLACPQGRKSALAKLF